ncbi:hypothetical protein CROQUDRAFT_681170 [Cronartium quercuum f. sp. fusiforme G11]|uniref:Uncharacterized protein n=1 Tax=Cronartium quercuum f. sp. fusiforme G11 TaxID=708437 RepID=A0A9P6NEJ7_9BASI|nr:hypothetical protein CROQUDRAFT_681170 [Cronartium quercuum f. sp. fusiforme G11]
MPLSKSRNGGLRLLVLFVQMVILMGRPMYEEVEAGRSTSSCALEISRDIETSCRDEKDESKSRGVVRNDGKQSHPDIARGNAASGTFSQAKDTQPVSSELKFIGQSALSKDKNEKAAQTEKKPDWWRKIWTKGQADIVIQEVQSRARSIKTWTVNIEVNSGSPGKPQKLSLKELVTRIRKSGTVKEKVKAILKNASSHKYSNHLLEKVKKKSALKKGKRSKNKKKSSEDHVTSGGTCYHEDQSESESDGDQKQDSLVEDIEQWDYCLQTELPDFMTALVISPESLPEWFNDLKLNLNNASVFTSEVSQQLLNEISIPSNNDILAQLFSSAMEGIFESFSECLGDCESSSDIEFDVDGGE